MFVSGRRGVGVNFDCIIVKCLIIGASYFFQDAFPVFVGVYFMKVVSVIFNIEIEPVKDFANSVKPLKVDNADSTFLVKVVNAKPFFQIGFQCVCRVDLPVANFLRPQKNRVVLRDVNNYRFGAYGLLLSDLGGRKLNFGVGSYFLRGDCYKRRAQNFFALGFVFKTLNKFFCELYSIRFIVFLEKFKGNTHMLTATVRDINCNVETFTCFVEQ